MLGADLVYIYILSLSLIDSAQGSISEIESTILLVPKVHCYYELSAQGSISETESTSVVSSESTIGGLCGIGSGDSIPKY